MMEDYDICNGIIKTEYNFALLYERSRIKVLAEQRDEVQKKTFTKWINSHLIRCGDIPEVEDLFMDLRDGRVLLRLLEVISGERLTRPSKGKLRIHCLENVTKALRFMKEQHVYLANIDANDVVDGNQTLTLGLVWTLILRFQIQHAVPDQGSGNVPSKEALLLWCQMKTAGFSNVSITNFTSSWKDGLAFNAILQKHDPDLVDVGSMTKSTPIDNMNTAFEIADKVFGVPAILEAKDVAVDLPDEKSIMTYIGMLSQALNKKKINTVKCKRLENLINEAIDVEKMVKEYEVGCADLLQWIVGQISSMAGLKLGESLPSVMDQMGQFKEYRLHVKPQRFKQRSDLEMDIFEIQTQLRRENRRPYMPPEGKLNSDVNRAWEGLEKEEHIIELRFYDELMRQEKLEQLGRKFHVKADIRENWLLENQLIADRSLLGENLGTVDAAINKLEALEGDVLAHQDRIDSLGRITFQLEAERFFKTDEVRVRFNKITGLWGKLLDDLRSRRKRLDCCKEVHTLFEEGNHLIEWMREIEGRLRADSFGRHLIEVENLQQRHRILARDIEGLDARVRDIETRMEACGQDPSLGDPEKARATILQLKESYGNLLRASLERETEMERYRLLWVLLEELSEDLEWAKEAAVGMLNPDSGHDLKSVERLIRIHDVAAEDIALRKKEILGKVRQVSRSKEADDSIARRFLIDEKTKEVEERLENLGIASRERRKKLEDSFNFHQLLADLEDLDTRVVEERRLFQNGDVGDNLTSSEAFLKQFEDQVLQVDHLQSAMEDLLRRKEALDKDDLDRQQESELRDSLARIDNNFDQLLNVAQQRRDTLESSLAKFRLMEDMEVVEGWISAKETFLHTLAPTEKVEELDVVKHRFDSLMEQMKVHSERLSQINDESAGLIDLEHPEAETISERQNTINRAWNDLADLMTEKQKDLYKSLAFNQLMVEFQETSSWIQDKVSLLAATDDLTDDLDGIMHLQRRLGTLQRDAKVIEAKVSHLNIQAEDLKAIRPKEEAIIDAKITAVNDHLEQMKMMLNDRNGRLSNFNELHKFLQDLDVFNVWLNDKQNEVAAISSPTNLPEAERFFSLNQQVQEEIDCWKPEVCRLFLFGRKISQANDNPQYLIFNQRLKSLDGGWEILQKMCSDKDAYLRSTIDVQMFFRDALQCDCIITKQESYLSKYQLPTTTEGLECAIRDFEVFKTSVVGKLPKIDEVLQFGQRIMHNNLLSEKVDRKCVKIKERCDVIQQKILIRDQTLEDELKLTIFTENVSDLEEWLGEKITIVSDTSYTDKKDASISYQQFKILVKELEANEERVNEIIKSGEDVIGECPHLRAQVQAQIDSISKQWSELIEAAQEKCDMIEEENRETIFEANTKSVMSWVNETSSRMRSPINEIEDIGLSEIKCQLKDQENKDYELKQRKEMLSDISNHAMKLKEQYPDREEEFDQIHMEVVEKLTQVEGPLSERRGKLSQQKKVQQFLRDVQDEKEWIEDKRDTLTITNAPPETFLVCIQRRRRLQTLVAEVRNHEPRITDLIKVGDAIIQEKLTNSQRLDVNIQELDGMWKRLLESLAQSQLLCDNRHIVFEYFEDARESESWMSDREFELWREETIKDEYWARSSMRKHESLTATIHDYIHVIHRLDQRSTNIVKARFTGWNAVLQEQKRLDRMYDGLIDLSLYRRVRIDDLIKLYQVFGIVTDLEEWIAECTLVAGSNDVGSDYPQCTNLMMEFKEFCQNTKAIGKSLVADTTLVCDKLIYEDNQESAEISYWKERVNEAWNDLLELMRTRLQFLDEVWKYFKFMEDTAELIKEMYETIPLIPECKEEDPDAVAIFDRKNKEFMFKLKGIKTCVNACINMANKMVTLYSGEKEQAINERKDELNKLWLRLKLELSNRDHSLSDMANFRRFSAMAEELLKWMTDIEQQLSSAELPRDACSVDSMLDDHRKLKREIEKREKATSACIFLGKSLLKEETPNCDQVRKNCIEIITKDYKIKDDLTERQESLEIMADIFQFTKRASSAEDWLKLREPHIRKTEVGDSLHDTLNLIQSHERLEHSILAKESAFNELKNVTRLEEKENTATRNKKSQEKLKKLEKLEELMKEFRTPPSSPKETPSKPIDDIEAVEEVFGATVELPLQKVEIEMDTSQSEEPAKSESTMSIESLSRQPMLGNVARKHEWETSVKRASNRTWHNLLMCLKANQLYFYKDEKHYKENKNATYKRELPLDLRGALSTVSSEYKKRSNVFRIHFSNGSEYLIQSSSDRQMKKWVDALNKAGGSDPDKHISSLPNKKSAFGLNLDERKTSLSFRKPK